jgi:hypothetical protein
MLRLPPTVAVVLAAATIASASCKYQNRPPNGAMLCSSGGTGTKRCPDGYACYLGTNGTNCSNTCWKVGDQPAVNTQCSGEDAGLDAHAPGDGPSTVDSAGSDGTSADTGGRDTSTNDATTNDASPCGTCPQGTFCGSGGMCMCNDAALTLCNGACVNLQTNADNCGGCGNNSCSTNSMGCSAGQCVCTANTTNGQFCWRPGQVRGTCWGGVCVLPAHFSGCNTAADCVPGGCTGPGGYCLGTVDVAGEVSCSDNTGAYVVCPAYQGCTDFLGARQPPFVDCGDGTGTGTGAVTCDGPSDCPANTDCCAYPGSGQSSQCTAQSQPGVIGSGCPSVGPGNQLPVLCDPLNPTTHCPTGKSCVPSVGTQTFFICQ